MGRTRECTCHRVMKDQCGVKTGPVEVGHWKAGKNLVGEAGLLADFGKRTGEW